MLHHLIFVMLLIGICYSSSLDSNGTFGGDAIDETGLVKLGRKLKNPVLTLVGMAIRNTRLRYVPCGLWTGWTPCDATERGYFGTQTRARSCSAVGDSGNTTESKELDSKLCEGDRDIKDVHVVEARSFCPKTFNLTEHGFCVKLNTTSMTHDNAIEQCKLDGGYLIHIDSKLKHDDVKALVHPTVDDVRIDGRRDDSDSQWKYTYGSPVTFLKWKSGYPTSSYSYYEHYRCLVWHQSPSSQWNGRCTYTYPSICEIVKN